MRVLVLGTLMMALAAAPVAAQDDNGSETRPALPTVAGDTGFWVVPVADVLVGGDWSASLFRSNSDRKQGLTDVSNIGFTVAYGATDRLELFGSWSLVRLDRDVSPLYVGSDATYGGVTNEFPHVRSGWSKNLGAPTNVGLKWNLLSQSRENAFSLAPRLVLSFPTGPSYGSTDAFASRADLVTSGEVDERFEISANVGGVYRADPGGYNISNGIVWGVGAAFPSRTPLRALVEAIGEMSVGQVRVSPGAAITADGGAVQPLVSEIQAFTSLKVGAVWQASSGFFVHGGVNYTPGIGDRSVGGTPIQHSGVDVEVSVGWHPGTRRFVPPPPPPAPPPPAPPPPVPPAPLANQNPTVTAMCDPCMLEVGETSTLTAAASDPDGDMLVFRWSAPQGSFSQLATPTTIWTAPAQPGVVTLTVTVEDGNGGSATSTVDIQVVQRVVLEFDPVYFDFNMSVIRPDAIATLDEVVAALQADPDLTIRIEGHTDSVGTLEYNLALGERRATAVFDYLVDRGVAAARMQTVSFGEESPAAPNDTAANWQLNRRAEIVIVIQ